MKTALTEMEWLERAAAGAREVLADYRTPTQLYPVDTETTPEERNYLAAQFQAHCVIPEFLKRGAKKEVPFIAHMRSGGYNTIQDLASELLTHCEDARTVERLAREIYAEASRRMGHSTSL